MAVCKSVVSVRQRTLSGVENDQGESELITWKTDRWLDHISARTCVRHVFFNFIQLFWKRLKLISDFLKSLELSVLKEFVSERMKMRNDELEWQKFGFILLIPANRAVARARELAYSCCDDFRWFWTRCELFVRFRDWKNGLAFSWILLNLSLFAGISDILGSAKLIIQSRVKLSRITTSRAI